MDAILEDGSKISSTEISLGVQLSMFPIFPAKGDCVSGPMPSGAMGTFLVDELKPDGLGGARLVLKAMQPVPSSG
jgi:hypothetical protein